MTNETQAFTVRLYGGGGGVEATVAVRAAYPTAAADAALRQAAPLGAAGVEVYSARRVLVFTTRTGRRAGRVLVDAPRPAERGAA